MAIIYEVHDYNGLFEIEYDHLSAVLSAEKRSKYLGKELGQFTSIHEIAISPSGDVVSRRKLGWEHG
jgi:hypothetical protein